MVRMLNVEINGRPAGVAELHRVATWNYGHFTSMQVRDGSVRGLGLHLRRLEEGSLQLFGEAVKSDGDAIRQQIRHALGAERDASVRVTLVPRPGDPSATDVMVSVSDPVDDRPGPALRVRTATYERELPHLKHAATMGLTYQLLRARAAGFDDVLFVGRDGGLREGSVWNVAFWDGQQVVWPRADVLPGITMQLLQAAMTRSGTLWSTRRLTADDLPALRAAAATNSHCPGRPLARIDEVAFADSDALEHVLTTAWADVPWDVV
ncbi:hypothetical protein SAVIM338S_00390 [Streptomyces avidinii]